MLSIRDCHSNPITQFEQWLSEAINAKVNEPTAMNIATVAANGRPSSRMVLLKEVNSQGFVFFTNYQSRKGWEIADNPFGCLTFFWAELQRQVRIEGKIAKFQRQNPMPILTLVLTPAVWGLGRASRVSLSKTTRLCC